MVFNINYFFLLFLTFYFLYFILLAINKDFLPPPHIPNAVSTLCFLHFCVNNDDFTVLVIFHFLLLLLSIILSSPIFEYNDSSMRKHGFILHSEFAETIWNSERFPNVEHIAHISIFFCSWGFFLCFFIFIFWFTLQFSS